MLRSQQQKASYKLRLPHRTAHLTISFELILRAAVAMLQLLLLVLLLHKLLLLPQVTMRCCGRTRRPSCVICPASGASNAALEAATGALAGVHAPHLLGAVPAVAEGTVGLQALSFVEEDARLAHASVVRLLNRL